MHQKISNTHHLPFQGYLRIPQIVPHLVPVSKSTWWAWVKEGKAPKPHKLGPKITAWKASEIHQFLNDLSENDESTTSGITTMEKNCNVLNK